MWSAGNTLVDIRIRSNICKYFKIPKLLVIEFNILQNSGANFNNVIHVYWTYITFFFSITSLIRQIWDARAISLMSFHLTYWYFGYWYKYFIKIRFLTPPSFSYYNTYICIIGVDVDADYNQKQLGEVVRDSKFIMNREQCLTWTIRIGPPFSYMSGVNIGNSLSIQVSTYLMYAVNNNKEGHSVWKSVDSILHYREYWV